MYFLYNKNINSMSERNQIIINGKEVKDDEDNNTNCQDYIISTNKRLQNEVNEMKSEINELNNTNNDLEEEISKEEQRRTYMKGLMHNLYDMKQKSYLMIGIYDNLLNEYTIYTDKQNKNKYIYSNISIEIFAIILFHIIPLLSYILHIINFSQFILIMSHQIIPVPILIYIINNRNEIEYPMIEKIYKDSKNELKESKKEIDEIDSSCRCLDDYIDDL